jgi:hypothetical protein
VSGDFTFRRTSFPAPGGKFLAFCEDILASSEEFPAFRDSDGSFCDKMSVRRGKRKLPDILPAKTGNGCRCCDADTERAGEGGSVCHCFLFIHSETVQFCLFQFYILFRQFLYTR